MSIFRGSRSKCLHTCKFTYPNNDARCTDSDYPTLSVTKIVLADRIPRVSADLPQGEEPSFDRSGVPIRDIPLWSLSVRRKERGNPFEDRTVESALQNQKFATERKRGELVPRKREDSGGGRGVPPRARLATPAGNSRRHGNTPEASPRARPPPHLTNTTAALSFSSAFTPSLPTRCFFHPEPPCRSPPSRESTRNPNRSAGEFESYVFYGECY